MRNPLTSLSNLSELSLSYLWEKSAISSFSSVSCLGAIAPLFLSVTLGCSVVLPTTIAQAQGLRSGETSSQLSLRSHTTLAQAGTSANAPAELTTLINQIDSAANRRDLKTVIQFYSPNFTHSDGLNRQSLETALSKLWQRYSQINYRTEITSWKAEGQAIIAETVTTITGTQKLENREITLKSTIRSQQRFEGQKIVKQEILAEKTQLSSGKNPPTIQVNLPEEVKTGQDYQFDAIVQEPLGNDILIGTALEEPATEKSLLTPTPADLELLNSGGIFKVGKAPSTPENRWISAVLIRSGGITMITQRLRVVKP
ncbi:MAG: nuclear transport factor 2 family protein [Actinomycetota bacterium]